MAQKQDIEIAAPERELSPEEKRFKEMSDRLREGKKVAEKLTGEKPSKPSEKKSTKKKSTKTKSTKKSTKKKKEKVKEKKPPKPLTLHTNYLMDIRRHKDHMKLTEDSWGCPLIIKETTMTVDGKKLPALIIAVDQS
jgi:hypothetical protein